MKKSLIALAALAAVSAASAQSSVTLYGIADIWVGKIKGSSAQAGSGGVNTSRWGLKGSEDLGGGLKANFNFESGIDLGNGALKGTLFGRQANVGFSGSFGTVKIGKSFNALDDMFGAANSGFDSDLSAHKVWLNSYNGEAAAQLYYATPDLNGFNAAVSTQLNGNTAGGTTKVTAFNVTYANGPIAAGLGYEEDKGNKQKGTMINGSYDLGVAKLMASIYNTKPIGAGTKINSYQLGADIPMSSALTLSVGYAASKPNGGQTNSAFGVAAAYSLSKRTTVYAGVRAESVKASNGRADGDIYAVGINHKF